MTVQHKINAEKLKPGWVTNYDIQPRNGLSPFLQNWGLQRA